MMPSEMCSFLQTVHVYHTEDFIVQVGLCWVVCDAVPSSKLKSKMEQRLSVGYACGPHEGLPQHRLVDLLHHLCSERNFSQLFCEEVSVHSSQPLPAEYSHAC